MPESTVEAETPSPSARNGRPATAKLFELRDLYRIPLWLLAKPMYAFAPISFHFALARLRGTLDWYRLPSRGTLMEILERHLGETTSPRDRRRIARRHFQSRAKARFCEIWPQVRNFAGVHAARIDGLEHLDAALERGKGAILATGHFGHGRMIKPILWSRDRAALVVALRGRERAPHSDLTRVGSFVHTRLLHLPQASQLDERWQRVAGTDFHAGLNVRPLLSALERNETVVILADGRAAQTLHRLPVVPGIDAYFAPGIATLARDTGAAVLPAFVVDDPERQGPSTLRLVIHPPLDLQSREDRDADIEANLRRFASAYGRQLRTHPHNWLWSWVRDGVFERPGGHRGRAEATVREGRGATGERRENRAGGVHR